MVGLMNIQYAIAGNVVYVLEANPRASRTVPLVSKVCNISMASIATELMMGRSLAEMSLLEKKIPHFGVKESVFPFNMFPEVDPLLGPEMRSTGEVLGLADSFGMAFYKAEEAAKQTLPDKGTALITVAGKDRLGVLGVAREFAEKHQIPIAKDKRGEAPFSVDANLLHSSSEGKVLEDPAIEPPPYVYQRTDSPEEAPDKATIVTIGFNQGEPGVCPADVARQNHLHGLLLLSVFSRKGLGILPLMGTQREYRFSISITSLSRRWCRASPV